MKRLLTVLLAGFGFALGLAASAGAHGSQYWDILWPKAPNPTNVHWGFNEEVMGGQKRDSIRSGANRWDFANGADFKFTQDLPDETADYPGWSRAEDCSPAPNNSVHLDNSIPDSGGYQNVLAVAQVCDVDGDGKISAFIVVFDRDDWNWNWDSGSPGSNQADSRSVAAHEFGHAWGGWFSSGHFTGSSLCPDNSGRHTMCATHILGTTWQRTLETHDSHTLSNAYPAP
jgi:hypothetical protein